MPVELSCAVDSALKIVGDRWSLAIIHELSLGPRRTVELHRGFKGISTKTLLARLRKMERAGLLTRRSFSESPPRVEYSLTRRGQSLLPVLTEMRRSVLLWDDLGRHDLVCKACAASNKDEEKATGMANQIADTTVTDSGWQAEPATRERGVRKRRDVTLL